MYILLYLHLYIYIYILILIYSYLYFIFISSTMGECLVFAPTSLRDPESVKIAPAWIAYVVLNLQSATICCSLVPLSAASPITCKQRVYSQASNPPTTMTAGENWDQDPLARGTTTTPRNWRGTGSPGLPAYRTDARWRKLTSSSHRPRQALL